MQFPLYSGGFPLNPAIAYFSLVGRDVYLSLFLFLFLKFSMRACDFLCRFTLMELSCHLDFGVSVVCILVFSCGSVSTHCTFYFEYCSLCGEHTQDDTFFHFELKFRRLVWVRLFAWVVRLRFAILARLDLESLSSLALLKLCVKYLTKSYLPSESDFVVEMLVYTSSTLTSCSDFIMFWYCSLTDLSSFLYLVW